MSESTDRNSQPRHPDDRERVIDTQAARKPRRENARIDSHPTKSSAETLLDTSLGSAETQNEIDCFEPRFHRVDVRSPRFWFFKTPISKFSI